MNLNYSDSFFQLFKNSPDAMFIFDGRVLLDCNQVALDLFKYPDKTSLLNASLSLLSAEKQLDESISVEKGFQVIHQIMQMGSERVEWIARRADGTEFPSEISVTLITIDQRNLLHVVVRDISHYKETERALRDSQRTLANMMSSLAGMAYRYKYDRPSDLEFVSEGCYELTYYTSADFLQTRIITYQGLMQPDEYPRIQREIYRAVTEHRSFKLTYRIKTARGTERWVLDNGRAVYDDNGKPIAIEGLIVDITERVLSYQLLEQRVQQSTTQFFTLLDVSRTVASTLKMEDLLGLILDQLRKVLEYNNAIIWQSKHNELTILAQRGSDEYSLEGLMLMGQTRFSHEILASREPIIIPDSQGGSPLATDFRILMEKDGTALASDIRCWMGLRLIARDHVIGMLTIGHEQPNHYSMQQARLTQAFANYAAIAIENAHLYAQAQEFAALEERQRLARELHDSVTQTLFSAQLIAEVLPDILKNNPQEAALRIKDLHELTRGALGEMRTLLLELRPKVLVETNLRELIQQLTVATIGRARLPIELDLKGNGVLSPPIQIVVYRIVQEALNNIARHANATQAALKLHYQSDQVELTIRDDGCGFNPTAIPIGHFGVAFMQERARSIGAIFQIDSAEGEGTEIHLSWTNSSPTPLASPSRET